MSTERPEFFPGMPVGEGMLVPSNRSLPPLPLEHTTIDATVVGPLCTVLVQQRFRNRHHAPIEALYLFPLPEDAAVAELTLTLGERVIRGAVREQAQARQEYEQARDAGQGAALLEQHRPNLFAVAVANIQPDERVDVALRFHQRLRFDDGGYELVLPTTTTPRYTPREQAADAPPNPPLLPDSPRDGHTIGITLTIDAGRIAAISSPSHTIDVAESFGHATVTLREAAEVPNRDFVLRYRVAGEQAAAAAFTVREAGAAGTVLLTLVPPLSPPSGAAFPREVFFVFDRSGSMGGSSIVEARNALRACLRSLNPADTFNIFPFDHEVEQFQPSPQPFTQASIDAADAYIATIEARGGTEIGRALERALTQPRDSERLRVVVFLTDGAVGNEAQVLGELRRLLGAARVFAFGVGPAVNRFLLSKLAEAGRGSVEYIVPGQDIQEAVGRFQSRAALPLLVDLALSWGGAAVTDVYPAVLPDLYAGQPLTVLARFGSTGTTTVTLSGRTTSGSYQQSLAVEWPAATPDRAQDWRALPTLWARARLDDLLGDGLHEADAPGREAALRLALEYGLLSPLTSLVAVEEARADHGERGRAQQVVVPIYLPQGLDRQGFEGVPGGAGVLRAAMMASPAALGSMAGGMARTMRQATDSFFAKAVPPAPQAAPPVGGAALPQWSSRERREAALRYLARTQSVDGSWAGSAVATSLAVAAFARAGHTDRSGSFRPQLSRAAGWLHSQAEPVVAWALAELAAARGEAGQPALPAVPEEGSLVDEQGMLALALEALRGEQSASEALARWQQQGGDGDGAVLPRGTDSGRPTALLLTATAAGALAWSADGEQR